MYVYCRLSVRTLAVRRFHYVFRTVTVANRIIKVIQAIDVSKTFSRRKVAYNQLKTFKTRYDSVK